MSLIICVDHLSVILITKYKQYKLVTISSTYVLFVIKKLGFHKVSSLKHFLIMKICSVCSEKCTIGNGISFHRFPILPQIRQEWIQSLKLHKSTIKQLSAFSGVCSKHFTSNDFHIISGKKYLSADAIPVPSPLACNLESGTAIIKKYRPILPRLSLSDTTDSNTTSSERISTSDGIVVERISGYPHNAPCPLSSQMVRNDQDEDAELSIDYEKQIASLVMSKRNSSIRYFGDISLKDFTCPSKSKRGWLIIKKTIMDQRRKIAHLQHIIRKRRYKIICQNSVLKHMQEKIDVLEESGKTSSGDK